jgi:hypothetical protein
VKLLTTLPAGVLSIADMFPCVIVMVPLKLAISRGKIRDEIGIRRDTRLLNLVEDYKALKIEMGRYDLKVTDIQKPTIILDMGSR